MIILAGALTNIIKMEYLEIIETIIPYVINQILIGVEDNII